MNFTEDQIHKLAPKASAFTAGKKLANANRWQSLGRSKRGLWGEIKGSGKNPYMVHIDIENLAYKCTCPSRQFPCKHSLALLLLQSQDEQALPMQTEPSYVAEWLDKRRNRAEKVAQTSSPLSAEESQERYKAKHKRATEREVFIQSGIEDLQKWLKDMVRLGLLELPHKPASYFTDMAAKMVDAKAPGLAAWVKALQHLPYQHTEKWQNEALDILGKLYVLLQAYQRKTEQPPEMQATLKSLIGWNLHKKEFLSDSQTLLQKDTWLVLGSIQEELEELTVHKSWLYGLSSKRHGMIMDFESKFASRTEVPLVDGSLLDAELAFYPGILPHRAVVKKQRHMATQNPDAPTFLPNWKGQHDSRTALLKQNPWISDQAYLLAKCKLLRLGDRWILCDEEKRYKALCPDFPADKILEMLMMGNNQLLDMAIVERHNGILPLGMFNPPAYISL
ncbi:MAG: SWIM zinc finger family protein [Bacteroidota bacterium]